MKIKNDFITNSSSTSYILESNVKFKVSGKKTEITKYGQDFSTLDMIKIIEGELQFNKDYRNIKTPLIIKYSQRIYDVIGDGWDGGDFNFAGRGSIFFGQTDILHKVMNKSKTEITFINNKLIFPLIWVEEFDHDYIEKHYKEDINTL